MAINRIKTGGITDGTIKSEDIAPGTIANDRLAGSIANAKLANSAITINGTSIALGASGEIVAGTDWQAVTVADGSTVLNAEAGKGYFLDTNTGVIEVFLPASPTRGDTFVFVDYGGNFATNKVIINAGTNLINSQDAAAGASKFQFELSTNNTIAELVYVDSSKGYLVKQNNQPSNLSVPSSVGGGYDNPSFISATGGTITTDGDFKIHVFTGDGNFVVSQGGGPLGIAGYLVVAGGGGAGKDDGGGGGGGGFRCGPGAICALHIPFSPGTYPVTVGAGGGGGDGTRSPSCLGAAGSNSVLSTITSAGGGAGTGGNCGHSPTMDGGSGGGSGNASFASCRPGHTLGQGNTPPVSPPQGNNGSGGYGHANTGGGGGGANQAASNTSSTHEAANGGSGKSAIPIFGDSPKPYYPSTPNGPNATFSGGGGGGALSQGGQGGSGGGGCGRHQPAPTGVGVSGNANHGGGGGGGANHPGPRCGGAGGKGIVLIKYRFQS